MYPDPAVVTVMELTAPPRIVAVAVAVVKPGGAAETVTVGALVYPAPPLVMPMLATPEAAPG